MFSHMDHADRSGHNFNLQVPWSYQKQERSRQVDGRLSVGNEWHRFKGCSRRVDISSIRLKFQRLARPMERVGVEYNTPFLPMILLC